MVNLLFSISYWNMLKKSDIIIGGKIRWSQRKELWIECSEREPVHTEEIPNIKKSFALEKKLKKLHLWIIVLNVKSPQI